MILMNKKEAYECFLTSSWWKELSRRKRRLVGKCERCQATRHLQSHHKFYRDNWFDTQLDDLEVLCRPCHESEHHIEHDTVLEPLPSLELDLSSKRKLMEARQHGLITRKQYRNLKSVLIQKGVWKKRKHRRKKKKSMSPQEQSRQYRRTHFSIYYPSVFRKRWRNLDRSSN